MKKQEFLIFLLLFFVLSGANCVRNYNPFSLKNEQKNNGTAPPDSFVTCPQTDIPWPSLANSPWPIAHGNPQCVARTHLLGPQEGKELWRVSLSGKPITSPVIGLNGTIYVTASDTGFSVFAIGPEGSVKWKFHPGRHLESGPMVAADGTIYVGAAYKCNPIPIDNSGAFYALNPDGTVKWVYELNIGTFDYGDAIGLDGTIFFVDWDGYLYALNPDGTLKWKTQGSGGFITSPTNSISISPDGSTLYVAGLDNTMNAVSAEDGTLRWQIDAGHPVYMAPAVDSQGNIYFEGSTDISSPRYLISVNPDGTERWRFPCVELTSEDIVIDYSGHIYLNPGDRLVALDYSGQKMWTKVLNGNTVIPLMCDGDGTIYVATCAEEGMLYAFNQDGTLKFKMFVGNSFGGAAIGENKIMYLTVKMHDNYLLAIK